MGRAPSQRDESQRRGDKRGKQTERRRKKVVANIQNKSKCGTQGKVHSKTTEASTSEHFDVPLQQPAIPKCWDAQDTILLVSAESIRAVKSLLDLLDHVVERRSAERLALDCQANEKGRQRLANPQCEEPT